MRTVNVSILAWLLVTLPAVAEPRAHVGTFGPPSPAPSQGSMIGSLMSLAAWRRVERDPQATVVCGDAVEHGGRATAANVGLVGFAAYCTHIVPRSKTSSETMVVP